MTIDPAALGMYRDIMGEDADEFTRDIVMTFAKSTEELLETMDAAIIAQGREEFIRAAHTLKSSSATVGAQHLSGLAADLESRGVAESLSDLAANIPLLRESYQQAITALTELYLQETQ